MKELFPGFHPNVKGIALAFIDHPGNQFSRGGVILITYTRDTTIREFFGIATSWILVSSVLASISIVTAKAGSGISIRESLL